MSESYQSTESLNLKGTIVVGGEHRGIGRAFSYGIAQAGANVAMLYRGESKEVPEDAKRIQDRFPKVKVRAYQVDCSDMNKLHESLKQVERDIGQSITGLIVNADTTVVKPALDLSQGEFQRVFGDNVFSVHNACCAAAKLWMDRDEEGSIVLVSSMSAQIINQASRNKPLTQAFYNASKAAARTLGKALAAEWAEKRIRVNTLSPGYVETDETRDTDKKIVQHQRENIPQGRFAQPKEIAGPALFLLSPHASYMTGTDVAVDGGQLIW